MFSDDVEVNNLITSNLNYHNYDHGNDIENINKLKLSVRSADSH